MSLNGLLPSRVQEKLLPDSSNVRWTSLPAFISPAWIARLNPNWLALKMWMMPFWPWAKLYMYSHWCSACGLVPTNSMLLNWHTAACWPGNTMGLSWTQASMRTASLSFRLVGSGRWTTRHVVRVGLDHQLAVAFVALGAERAHGRLPQVFVGGLAEGLDGGIPPLPLVELLADLGQRGVLRIRGPRDVRGAGRAAVCRQCARCREASKHTREETCRRGIHGFSRLRTGRGCIARRGLVQFAQFDACRRRRLGRPLQAGLQFAVPGAAGYRRLDRRQRKWLHLPQPLARLLAHTVTSMRQLIHDLTVDEPVQLDLVSETRQADRLLVVRHRPASARHANGHLDQAEPAAAAP